MHGKLLILVGLAVSGGMSAAAVVGLEPRFFLHTPPRVPHPFSGSKQLDAVVTRLGLTDRGRCVAVGRASLQTGFRRGALCHPTIREASATLRLAPDGLAAAVTWSRLFPDSSSAALAQDSLAALLAPGRTQLACDIQQHPRYVLAITLLAVDSVLVNFELRGATFGTGGYSLYLRAERLEPLRVRFLCWRPLGPLH